MLKMFFRVSLLLCLLLPMSGGVQAQTGIEAVCPTYDDALVAGFNTVANEIFQASLQVSVSILQNPEPNPDALTEELAAVYAISNRFRAQLLNGPYQQMIDTCDDAANVVGALGTIITIAYTGTLDRYPAITAVGSPRDASALTTLSVETGYGAEKGFWTVYFNAPTGSSDRSTYTAGIDVPLAERIAEVKDTLDIVAFEFDNERLTAAVLDAHARGIQVRIVTDDEHGLEEEDESIPLFVEAGIPVVDDERAGLMHNKFMILDGEEVWTGSWNYTSNGTYRNNNNALVLRSEGAVSAYSTEFEEMFVRHEFGVTSTEGAVTFKQDGVPIQILFSAEDAVIDAIVAVMEAAESDIRFMAFSYTHNRVGEVMRERALAGVNVQGIFELRGSETVYSELPVMYCAGLDVRQDGSRYVLHHKVIIVDDHTVVTGSFNFSGSAESRNDENVVIIRDPDLAALYIAEYERLYADSSPPPPGDIECGE